MSILPRTRRGVWLTAAATWSVGVVVWWLMLPLQPRIEAKVSDDTYVETTLDNRTLLLWETKWVGDRRVGDEYTFLDTATGHRRVVGYTWDGLEGQLSPDGRWLVVADPRDAPAVRLVAVDTRTGRPHATWRFDSDDAKRSGAFWRGYWRGGEFALTDSMNCEPRIQLFDIAAGTGPRVLANATGQVSLSIVASAVPRSPALGIGYSTDGRYLFFQRNLKPENPGDAEMMAWDGTREHSLGKARHDFPIHPVVWTGERVVCESWVNGLAGNSLLGCYEVGTGRELWTSAAFWPWRLLPDRHAAVGAEQDHSGDVRIVVRSMSDWRPVRETACPRGVRGVMDISPDGALALAVCDEGVRYGWLPQWGRDLVQRYVDFPSGDSVLLIDTASGRGTRIASSNNQAKFLPDGRSFYTWEAVEPCVRVWDVLPRKPMSWLAAGAAAWAVPLALVTRWRMRRCNPRP